MKKSIFLTAALAALAMLTAGCSEDADSEDIRTSGIYAEMEVVASTDNQSAVEVALKVGGSASNTYVNLTSGDKLTATVNGGNPITLSKKTEDFDKKVTYIGTFSNTGVGLESAQIKVAFERPVDTSALDSSVTLPAPVGGMMLTPSDQFDRSSESVVLNWTSVNADETLALEYSGDCIESGGATVVDNGTYTINALTIQNNPLAVASTCTVKFSLGRSATGTLDSAFGEGGYIRATQTRSVNISSTP